MRPDKDTYFLRMAKLVSTRSTCYRRNVGCVLTNSRGHVLSTGYNGVASGQPHCNYANEDMSVKIYPNACNGATATSGTQLDTCEAIHAEQNALLQCKDVFEIDTAYVTTSPCMTCVKLLLNTSCNRIVFSDAYSHIEAIELWKRNGRLISQRNV